MRYLVLLLVSQENVMKNRKCGSPLFSGSDTKKGGIYALDIYSDVSCSVECSFITQNVLANSYSGLCTRTTERE